jgi:hypothetical protein
VKPSFKEITRATGLHFGISVESLLGQSRDQKHAWPRQIAMFLCREMTGKSLPEIGRYLGNRDHTTVLYGVREVERAAEGDETLKVLMAIAAQATAYARAREERILNCAQQLHCGRTMALLLPVADVPKAAIARPSLRRVAVLTPRRPVMARPRALPSDLKPPSRARLMGARA